MNAIKYIAVAYTVTTIMWNGNGCASENVPSLAAYLQQFKSASIVQDIQKREPNIRRCPKNFHCIIQLWPRWAQVLTPHYKSYIQFDVQDYDYSTLENMFDDQPKIKEAIRFAQQQACEQQLLHPKTISTWGYTKKSELRLLELVEDDDNATAQWELQ